MLAFTIFDRTNNSLTGILETIEKYGGPTPTGESIAHAFRELICAHYSLAVAILGQDEAAERMRTEAGAGFYLYTAATFSELERPLGPVWVDTDQAWGPLGLRADLLLDKKLLEPLCLEATQLYLEDRPDLRKLAESAPEYCYNVAQVQAALKRNDWSVTFYTKAWIRLAKAMDLKGSDPTVFLPTLTYFSVALLASIDVFKGLRPALLAE
jgi:hypothetical protein